MESQLQNTEFRINPENFHQGVWWESQPEVLIFSTLPALSRATTLNALPPGKFCMLFCRRLIFFKINFLKNSFRNTIRVSNSLDPDQAQHFVGPDLGQNCLQKLSADDTSR